MSAESLKSKSSATAVKSASPFAASVWSRELTIATIALVGIVLAVALRYSGANFVVWPGSSDSVSQPAEGELRAGVDLWTVELWEIPLLAVLLIGGLPLVIELIKRMLNRQFDSDLLAGISIVTAFCLGEYLAGALVVLMLSGGQALEAFAVRRASSALLALSKRMPNVAHRKTADGIADISLDAVQVGDLLTIMPHEICPVDGVVVDGHSTMDESYLTGEPYVLSKAVGSSVMSGAINGIGVLTIHAEKRAIDSRYAKIMQVMKESEQRRPGLRRLGDQLGAIYTPVALTVAILAWIISGHANRFLAVMVVATPCPLLIAIPVAIIGSISLAARRGIIIRDPAVLEKIDLCQTAIFDKTGTLTYGRPQLTEVWPAGESAPVDMTARLARPSPLETPAADRLLREVASLERYSRHPLAEATVQVAEQAGLALTEPSEISERPGEGLRGIIQQQPLQVTSRQKLLAVQPQLASKLPPMVPGMECVVLRDNQYAGLLRFRDEPRQESQAFIHHLKPAHGFQRVMIVSGDRETEVRHLAARVGITEVLAAQSPEQKVEIVRAATMQGPTVFLGDGINDAPALTAATVGIAFGQRSDVTSEAAGAVVLDASLQRVDELMHIGRRMRTIALQSAVGGMLLSFVGMLLAAGGWISPVMGAVAQEAIDVLSILNALRAAFAPRTLTDYDSIEPRQTSS